MDVFSEKFLNWLSEETKDGKRIFYAEGLNDGSNRCGLETLYKEVDNYAKMFFYYNTEEYGRVYNIKDRDNLYTLSMFQGPTIGYFIQATKSKANYLDLDDVKRGLLRGKENIQVFEYMQEVTRALRGLKAMGVPIDVVSREVDSELRSLRSIEQREKQRVHMLTMEKNNR